MDIGGLLKPIEDNAPSGPNLEYERAFQDMELAGQYGTETQIGDIVREAQEPDFAKLGKLAREVLDQSHDIRAAVYLAEAVVRTGGLVPFAEVAQLVLGYLQDYWDSCHPQLDEDDGDATMRINAVQGLSDSTRTIRALRRAPLTDSRMFGRFTLRDIEIADGEIAPPEDMENAPDITSVTAAFQDTDAEVLAATAQAVREAIDSLDAIDTVFSERTPGDGPRLDPVIRTLRDIAEAFGRFADEATGEEAATDDADEDDGPAPAAARGGGGGGAINSPADVTAALDRIMAYYARSEPSSPVPLLLDRAKRLVGADFLSIIKDLANDSLTEVRRVGGLPEDSEY